MDLTKLSPAPWTHDPEGEHTEIAGYLFCSRNATDAEFVALARQAFDVMKRRLWFPRFIGSEDGRQRWEAYSWYGCQTLAQTTAVCLALEKGQFVYDDPFTCLVEADKWYAQNCDQPATVESKREG